MEKTFQDPAASTQFQNDAERQQENAKRADQGQPQIPGVADRETVASKDPKEFDTRGGPGSEGNKPIQDPVL
ncbi:uncharacterized protein UMAG_10692 [Mycosarcoma maydis]|uniref:Uncharacterized protein n=1 Tax=Mycosarcoma maydis TaxID=5270 RepID=A0A0D1BXW2_MYCMD|nr:uncharacterized protein UMAG_10692 [Ustilago maydis 521]KIS66747.1 hypothetical protein UMAG_10692 [Ustilago maydis 521]|eukprot:XP_011391744.1 hypothetical protein UMAG_10692 [Ustilago maydis 521]